MNARGPRPSVWLLLALALPTAVAWVGGAGGAAFAQARVSPSDDRPPLEGSPHLGGSEPDGRQPDGLQPDGLQPDGRQPGGPRLDPPVAAAWDLLLAGESVLARSAAQGLLVDRSPPPLGALSVWLAAGAEVDHNAWHYRVEDHPAEPRLQAIAARRARHVGDRATAARHLAFALQLPLADALVVAEARQLGWEVADAGPSALPGPSTVTASADAWLLLGLFIVLAGMVAAARSRDWRAAAGLLAGLVVVALLPPDAAEPRPALPDVLATPLQSVAAGGCAGLPTFVERDQLRMSLVCPDGSYRHVDVVPVTDAAPAAPGGSPYHHVWGAEGKADVAALAARHAALAAVEEAEAAGFRLAPWLERGGAPGASVGAGEGPAWRLPRGGEAGQLAFAGLLVVAALIASLLSLPAVLATLARRLAADAPGGLAARRALATGLLGLVLVHLLVGDHLVMSFGVYEIEPFIGLSRVPRYGPGAVWFYGPLQWALGTDHRWILALNRLFGLASTLTAVALAARLFERPAVPAITACVLATLPVVWLGHTSESILVGPTWVVLTGLWLALDPDRRPAFVTAALAFGAAALSRPEMVVAMGAVPFVIALLRGRDKTTGWLTMAALVLAVVGVEASWVADKAQEMEVSGSLDFARDGGLATLLWNMGGVIGAHDIFLNPTMTPTVLLLGLVAAVARPATRWRSAWLLVWGVGWMMATTVDLTAVSIPRLQLPVVMLLVPVAAAGLDQAWLRVTAGAAQVGSRPRRLAGAFLLLYSGGVALNAGLLLRPDNAAAEEALWRDALAKLPAGPGCLVTLGHADPPDGGLTSRHVPGYLLTERVVPWSVDDLYQTAELKRSCDGPVYALLGVRCYAHLRRPGEPAPAGAPPVEGCRALRERWSLTPVLERDLPNLGDRDYPMYPAGGPLRVGLYQVGDLRP